LEGKDLKKPKEILKFSKVKDWIPPIILVKSKVNESKTPNSEMFSWNTLGIPDNIRSKFHKIKQERKSLPIEKLISSPGIPSSKILTKETPKATTPNSDPIFISNQNYTNLKFGSYNIDNPFEESSSSYKPVTTTFPLSFPM